jgi:hypothetical protein
MTIDQLRALQGLDQPEAGRNNYSPGTLLQDVLKCARLVALIA